MRPAGFSSGTIGGGSGGFGDNNENNKVLIAIAGIFAITTIVITYFTVQNGLNTHILTPPVGVDYLERELEERLLKNFIDFFNKKTVSASEFGDFLGTFARFLDRASDREKRLLLREILEATGVKFDNLDQIRDYVYDLLRI